MSASDESGIRVGRHGDVGIVTTADHCEGVRALLEKRMPGFVGP